MTTGKYLPCILCLAAGACLLAAHKQTALHVKLLPAPAALSNDPKLETPAVPSVAMAVRNRTLAPFTTTAAESRAAPISPPITLEENVGQAEESVAFLGRGKGMTALLTRTGIEILVGRRSREKGTSGLVKLEFADLPASQKNSNRSTGRFLWRGERKVRGESNYLLGNDPRRWRTHVAHFDSAGARDVFPGFGIVVYGNDEGIEYDLQVAPGTDVDRLRLEVSGGQGIRLDPRGNLLMVVADRLVLMRKPAIFVEHVSPESRDIRNPPKPAADREPVEGGYVLEADGSVGFWVAPHDPHATLVLDPSLSLSYATFLGGPGGDSANSIALDSSGKLYVAGTTTSAATFSVPGGSQNGPGGATDFFIAKIDPTAIGANSLLYLTFLGGSGDESGGQIAVDESGNVAIMGTTTSPDFPVTDSSKRTSGSNDLTISEIGPTGSTLIFSTLFGGNGTEATENIGGIAFDKSANIFVASDTSSNDLATTPGAFKLAYGGGTSDGFLAVFRPSATRHLKYCTYLGINAQVSVGGVAVDAGGNAYIAGSTSNPGSSFTALNAFQNTFGGDPSDAFLMKIRPSGTGAPDLAYGTFLGGSGLDKALAVAVGAAMPATAYVTGTTGSTNFPLNGTRAGPQTTLKGTANAFFVAVAQDGTTGMTSLNYSTYLGGGLSDQGLSVAVTAANAIYVTGKTTSYDFPWLENFQPFNGDEDAFIAKLDPTAVGAASLIYATPLGGTAPVGVTAVAEGNAIAVDTAGHIFLAGRTTAADFPRAGNPGNGFQPICASCQASPPAGDAFVLAIQESALARPSVSFTAAKINFGPQSVGNQNIPPGFGGVVNTGDAPLNIASVGILGPNASDFALLLTEACMSAPIPPGPPCSVEVSFVPSTVGPEKAFLTFTDDGPASPQVLEIVGIGSGPLAVPSPASLSFGNQPMGTSSNGQEVRLKNLGNQNLLISNYQTTGPGLAQFAAQADPSCPIGHTVTPGATCTFIVTFAPTAVGFFQAEIDVFDDSGNVQGAEQVIPLTGTGTSAAPIVSLLPAQLTFGSQSIGTISAAQMITLKNSGDAALTFTGIGLVGSDAASFGIVAGGGNACPVSGGTLAIGASCTVAVTFAPQSVGTKSASLKFTDNASSSPQEVPVTGDVIAPAIQISPGSLNFATETVGMTSATQTVTLSNTGQGPLAINGISLMGASPVDFKQTNNCPPSLGAGNTCTLSVTLTPVAQGNRAASISIADNAPGSPHTVSLMGVGVVPAVMLTPISANFGPQLVGTSTVVDISVANSGAGILDFSKITLAGPNAADFSETDTCAGLVSASGMCTIHVSFNPATIGPKSATLTLTDNTPGSPQSIPVSGTAMDFSIGPAAGGAISATVRAGDSATYQLQVTSMNGFAGMVAFAQCTGEPSASTCTVVPTTLPVVANSTAPFQVNVTTMARSLARRQTTSPQRSPGRRPATQSLLWELLLVLWVAIFALCGLGSFLTEPRRIGCSGRLNMVTPVRAALVWVLLVGALASCGGSGTGTAGTLGTPAGTSTLMIAAASGSRKQIISLTLTVVATVH